MAERAELSVVMSVYNGARDLANTIDSVLLQEGVELEFIIVDDGSTDETPGILARYADRDPRIRVLTQANAGLTTALIAGCNAAAGEYIARQDCGDWSLPQRFAKQLALLRSAPEAGFVSCWAEFRGPRGEPLSLQSGRLSHSEVVDLVQDFDGSGRGVGPSCHPSVVFRRELYSRCGGYRGAFRYGQDWDLWYRMAEKAKFAMVPEVLYVARFPLNCISLSRKPEQSALSALAREAARLRRAGFSDREPLERAMALSGEMSRRVSRADLMAANYFVGESLRRQGDPRARAYLMESWRTAPWNPRPLLRLLQDWHRRLKTR